MDYKSVAGMRHLYESTKNWGKWGKDDEAGALNYITPDKIAKAGKLIRSGRQVSCAQNFPVHPGPDNPSPAHHHMTIAGDDCCVPGVPGLQVATDYISIAFHGMKSSHIDALCHVFVDMEMYNGRSATEVKSTGAKHNSIYAAREGIVGRGVLLDIPRLRGATSILPTEEVTPDELLAAAKAQNVEVGEGDILLVYLGREARRATQDDHSHEIHIVAGLRPDCATLIHKWGVAVLGSDGVSDPVPANHGVPDWPMPLHMFCLVGMGVHLLDNLSLQNLAKACAEEKRWEFFFAVAPLRIEQGTGSPINPIAIF